MILALVGIQHLNDGVFITDHNNKIVFVNRAIEKITGYKEEELIGKTPSLLKSGMHDRKFYQKMWRSLNEDGKWEGEVFNKRKSQQLYCQSLKIIVIKNEQNKLSHYIAVLSDITKEKELEKELLLTSKIQQRLLPKEKNNQYYNIKAFYKPQMYVSGDFYDYVWLEDSKKLYGIILDFKGHGLAAALLTSAVQVLFRKTIHQASSLEEKMKLLNELSMTYFTEDCFAAALYFELDFVQDELSYVSAGITHFLVASRTHKKLVSTPGLFLGISKDENFDKNVISINPGDQYYFMTDGVLEHISESNSFLHNKSNDFYDYLCTVLEQQALKDDASFVCIEVTKEKFRQFIFFDVEEFHQLKKEILSFINNSQIGEKELVWMALVEAVNNAWLHGNKRCSNKSITLKIKVTRGGKVIIRIKDEGNGFLGNALVKKYTNKIEEEFEKRIYSESGRGLLIIMKVFEGVVYNRIGNELLLMKRIKVGDQCEGNN